jgi:hypothetical protein
MANDRQSTLAAPDVGEHLTKAVMYTASTGCCTDGKIEALRHGKAPVDILVFVMPADKVTDEFMAAYEKIAGTHRVTEEYTDPESN